MKYTEAKMKREQLIII